MNPKQTHAFRLLPAEDLKVALIAFCREQKIDAACILSAVGSLEAVKLRLANSGDLFEARQKFEIVSVTGTVSQHGAHIHAAVADSKGAVTGGHVMDGNIIFTTCEVVLLELKDAEFKRELDPATGFKELKIYLTNS